MSSRFKPANCYYLIVSRPIAAPKAFTSPYRSRVLTLGYLVTGVLAVVLRWPTMNFPLSEAHAFRQFQTTLMIREYMEGGILQLSPLPLFGPPWQVPMEFPLFQWIAALGGTAVGASPQIAGRLTALVFFLICAALVALVGTRLYSTSAGFVGFVIFLFAPFGWQWGSAPLIEFAATAGALISIYLIMMWIERRLWWLLVALSVSLSLVTLVKITTAVVWVLPIVAISLAWKNTDGIRGALTRWPFVIPLGISGILGIAWARLSDSFKGGYQFTQFLTSEALTTWNFGSVDQRLDTRNWAKIFEYSEAINGLPIIFFALVIAALAVWRVRLITIAFASTLFVGPMVFFNLYYMHGYYLSSFYPAIVIVMAAGVIGIASLVRDTAGRMVVTGAIVLSVLVMAWTSPEGQLVSQRSTEGLYQFPLAEEIADNTEINAGVIMIGCDWNPAYSYLSGRKTLMLSGRNPDETIPLDWIGSEFQYLASCAEDIDPRAASRLKNPLIQVSPHVWRIAF